MEIYLAPLAHPDWRFQFPSMPDGDIDIRHATLYQEYSIIGMGRLSFPSGMDKEPIKWSGMFWGSSRRRISALNRRWQDPMTCINTLNNWQKNKTPLNLIISGGGVNRDVTIQEFDYKPTGGHGDFSYHITLYPYTELKIYTTAELGIKSSTKKQTAKKKKTNRNNAKKTAAFKKKTKKYTIKYGDTLWGISRKYYGSGTKWTKIYNKNKSAIEKAAKKHGFRNSNGGNRIWPGTTLTIP